jgi:hypothetical protein
MSYHTGSDKNVLFYAFLLLLPLALQPFLFGLGFLFMHFSMVKNQCFTAFQHSANTTSPSLVAWPAMSSVTCTRGLIADPK